MDIKIGRRKYPSPKPAHQKSRKRCPVCNKLIQSNDEDGSLVTRCRCIFTYPEGNHKGICPQCKNKIPINFSYG